MLGGEAVKDTLILFLSTHLHYHRIRAGGWAAEGGTSLEISEGKTNQGQRKEDTLLRIWERRSKGNYLFLSLLFSFIVKASAQYAFS